MMNSFDKAAGAYQKYGHIQRDMAAWLAEWLPKGKSGRAIEIAAGTGFFTSHLKGWVDKLTVTDSSPAMVLAGHRQAPWARWRIARAEAIEDENLEWIFSSSFLHWSERPVELLAHWRDRLRDGGKIMGGLFAEPTLPELRELAEKVSPLTWHGPAEWKEMITRAGLELEDIESRQHVYLFPSAIELLRVLHRVGAAPTRRMGPGQLRELLRAYDATFAEAEGVRSTWTFLRFIAVRR